VEALLNDVFATNVFAQQPAEAPVDEDQEDRNDAVERLISNAQEATTRAYVAAGATAAPQ
jgi:hypothetical protein